MFLKSNFKSLGLAILGFLSILNRVFILDKCIYIVHKGNYENLLAVKKKCDGKIFVTGLSPYAKDFNDAIIVNDLRSKIIFFFYLVFSEKIFIADSLDALSFINFSPKQKVIQLWHACGAFKKFGLASTHNFNVRDSLIAMYSRYSFVSVSSPSVVQDYMRAFGLDEEKVLPLGVPRTDYFFSSDFKMKKKDLEESFSFLRDKKIILYAPTFRDNEHAIVDVIKDLLRFESNNPNCKVIYSFHPLNKHDLLEEYIEQTRNFTFSVQTSDLFAITDILVSDYSSVIFEYSLLEKPMIFSCYDLDEYLLNERAFFYDYETFVPGPIVSNFNELEKAIKNADKYKNSVLEFKEKFMGSCDGNSTQRIVDYLNE